ncbi:MAG: prepilin peptidase [Candidatus Andersenbacteria bacterium]|nr:prepilin peptidase [Candidatus Andersenbacteria bacterium]
MSVIYPFLFVFGAAVGSFLNVVILRSLKAETLGGRSYCPHCKQQLSARDLIPIFSFIFLHGRCRTCFHPISIQYPVVELVVGILLMLTYPDILLFIATCLLVVLFVIDLKSFILPDTYIVILTVTALLRWPVSLPGAAIGAGFLLILWLATRGKGIGLGDVKLMVPLGLMAGVDGTVAILSAAFFFGAVVGLLLIATGKASRKTAIPFGPFLAGAAILVLLFPAVTSLVQLLLYPWPLVR